MIPMSSIIVNLHHSAGYSLVFALVTREHLSCPVAADQLDIVNKGKLISINYEIICRLQVKIISALYEYMLFRPNRRTSTTRDVFRKLELEKNKMGLVGLSKSFCLAKFVMNCSRTPHILRGTK